MPTPAPHTAPDAASELYRGAAGHAYHEGKRGVPETALPWIHRLRAEKFQGWVKPTDTVVEFGVGSGWNLAGLNCARKIGCDAADDPTLRRRLDAMGVEFVGTLETLAAGTANVLLCHHALEHVLDPVHAFHSFRRVLRPDGVLVVHVPWEIERRYARYNPDEPNHHLFGWNAQTLGNLAAVLGWQIRRIGVRPYGYDRAAARLAVRFGAGERGFRCLRWIAVRLFTLREVELVAAPGEAGGFPPPPASTAI